MQFIVGRISLLRLCFLLLILCLGSWLLKKLTRMTQKQTQQEQPHHQPHQPPKQQQSKKDERPDYNSSLGLWPASQPTNARLLLLPDHVTIIINPDNISTDPLLLVVVCSAVENIAAREAIRNSWAQDQIKLPEVRVVFLMGHLANRTLQEDLVVEANTHGDLVQEDFVDSYANLTIKSLMLLKWTTWMWEAAEEGGRASSGIQYVLKTDDDMFINLVWLLEIVKANKNPNLLLGQMYCNMPPIRDPSHKKFGKWYMPYNLYPDKFYPTFLVGHAYVMSRKVVSALYQEALITPMLHLEDVYITGILAHKANIHHSENLGFIFFIKEMNPCLTVAFHKVEHEKMRSLYLELPKIPAKNCEANLKNSYRGFGKRCGTAKDKISQNEFRSSMLRERELDYPSIKRI